MMRAVLFLLGVLLSYPAAATPWFVSTAKGSSSYPGTEALPKSAASQLTVAAGDEVYFERGTAHPFQITCVSGNSSSDPTVYGAYGTGAAPILTTNNNVFICQDKDFVQFENIRIRPTLSTAAAVRADSPQDLYFINVEFDGTGGGLDGIRTEAITSATQTMNNVIVRNSWFHDFAQGDGIRMVIGPGDGPLVSVGVSVTGSLFERIGKAPARFTYQNASFGGRDHGYRSFTFTDNTVRDSLLVTPAVVDDDQCLHFRNIRETTLGQSVIARNLIKNCGRVAGDATEITGYWFEGLKNVLVYDNVADGIFAPDKDGGAFFLDSSCFALVNCSSPASDYVSEGNYFLRNEARNTYSNKLCTPFTAVQCNNSEGFSITRGANGNTFVANIAYMNAIGFHVTGNAGQNFYYNNVAVGNDYGIWIQTNNGDTPPGAAQIIRNSIFWGNAVTDYQYATSFPKADEQFNDIGTIVNSTKHGTDLSVDPKFIGGPKPSTADGFQLKPTSPLIGAGTYVGKILDFTGRKMPIPANIGAFGQHMAASRRTATLQ